MTRQAGRAAQAGQEGQAECGIRLQPDWQAGGRQGDAVAVSDDMEKADRDKLVAQYKDGYRVVAEALAGASEAELDKAPAPNKWTPRQIVHHLADSEMTSAVRLRLLIGSDRPQIMGYDQDEFARRLYYQDRSVAASLEAFRAARETTGEILDHLTDAEWQREGTHSEIGRYTVESWLEIYGVHAHNHAEQIRRARQTAHARNPV